MRLKRLRDLTAAELAAVEHPEYARFHLERAFHDRGSVLAADIERLLRDEVSGVHDVRRDQRSLLRLLQRLHDGDVVVLDGGHPAFPDAGKAVPQPTVPRRHAAGWLSWLRARLRRRPLAGTAAAASGPEPQRPAATTRQRRRRAASAPPTVRPPPDPRDAVGKVAYGSTDLSRIAIDHARTHGVTGARNVAVFEYTDKNGVRHTRAAASQRGKGHAEKLIAEALKRDGIPNDRVTRIYSELEPCSAPGGFCKDMITKGARRSKLGPFRNARVTWSVEYGGDPHDPARAAKGVETLRALRAGQAPGRRS